MYRSRKLTKKYSPDTKRKLHYASVSNCPFCVIPNSSIVFKGKDFLVVKNLYPYELWEFLDVKEHLMLVPRRHLESMTEFSEAERLEAIKLMIEYESKGFNVYAREPNNRIKSVQHQHTHLIKTNSKKARAYIYLKKPYFIWKI